MAQTLTLVVDAVNKTQGTLHAVSDDVDRMGKTAQKSGGMLSGFGKSLGGVASIASGFAVGAGMMALPGLLDSISDKAAGLELNAKKIATVFGPEETAGVKAWGDANAAAMGLTSNKAQSLAANFADLLIPMGFTRETAAKMSTDVVGLSGALAEWSGGTRTAAEVSATLAKAMLGEREELKGLGISITEEDVKRQLQINGTAKLTGAALEQAKALATQQLILAKSTDAQTAFANGSDSAARAQAEMAAKIETAKEKLAVGLQPMLLRIAELKLKLVDVILTQLMPAFDRIVAWVTEHQPQIEAAFNKIRDAVVDMWDHFQIGLDIVWPKFQAFAQFLEEHQPLLVAALIAIGVAMVLALGPVSGAVLAITALITLIGYISEHIDDVQAAIERWHLAPFVNAAMDQIERMVNVIRTAINLAKELANLVGLGGGGHLSVDRSQFSGGIGEYATGGTVPGPRGAPRLAIVHGGERITPVGEREAAVPGSGVTVYLTVNAPVGSDAVSIGNQIVGIINEAVRNGGSQLSSQAVA